MEQLENIKFGWMSNISEVARLCGVSRQTVYNLIEAGKARHRWTDNGVHQVRIEDVMAGDVVKAICKNCGGEFVTTEEEGTLCPECTAERDEYERRNYERDMMTRY